MFSRDQQSAEIGIPIVNDADLEGPETFTFALSEPSGATLGEPSTATVTIEDDTAKPAPSGLALVVRPSYAVNVKWTDNCSNETGFEIHHSADGGATWSPGVTAPPVDGTGGSTSKVVTGVSAGATYTFRVRAIVGSVGSVGMVGSDYAQATVKVAPPTRPISLTVSTQSCARIKVQWRDQADNESGFKVERSTDGGATYPAIVNVMSSPGSGLLVNYTDTGLTPDTTYTYRVKAYNGAGDSSYIGPKSAATQAVPDAPTGLTVVRASATTLKLYWTDEATTEQGFKLQRSTDGGATWTLIATVAPATGLGGTKTYADRGLAHGTTYTYRVRAFNDAFFSAYSNTASGTP